MTAPPETCLNSGSQEHRPWSLQLVIKAVSVCRLVRMAVVSWSNFSTALACDRSLIAPYLAVSI